MLILVEHIEMWGEGVRRWYAIERVERVML